MKELRSERTNGEEQYRRRKVREEEAREKAAANHGKDGIGQQEMCVRGTLSSGRVRDRILISFHTIALSEGANVEANRHLVYRRMLTSAHRCYMMRGNSLHISMDGLRSRFLLGLVWREEFVGATMKEVIGHTAAEPAPATNKWSTP
jgi:hypothetical protein